MASQIPFFASADDDARLREHITSLGLWVVPCYVDLLGQPLGPPEEVPFCFVSGRRPSTLLTTSHPRPRFNPALSPLIQLTRSYREEGYLVAGRFWFESGLPAGAEMRPAFEAIEQWVREEWEPLGHFWVGPDAAGLRQAGSVEFAPVSPAVEYRIVPVGRPRGEDATG